MKNKKTVIEILLSIIVIAATLACLFRGDGFAVFLRNIRNISTLNVALSMVLLLSYILLESVIIKIIMDTLDEEVTFGRCCKYSFIGFFFYCISPAGSLEQPSQMYAMHRDGLSPSRSLFAMTVITITFKMAIVILGISVLALRPAEIMEIIEPMKSLCILGIVLSSAAVAGFACLLLIPANIESLAKRLVNLMARTSMVSDPESLCHRIEEFVAQYSEVVQAHNSYKAMFAKVQAVTVVQRVCLMVITVMAARSIGVLSLDPGTVVTVQGMIQLATEMMPLPGGVGLNELLFMKTFGGSFGINTLSVLIISRGISFYGQLIVCGLASVAITVIERFTERKSKEERKKYKEQFRRIEGEL